MSQSHIDADDGAPPSTPRWVKVFAVVAIVLIVLFVGLHLTGNTLGGPGSHASPSDHGWQQP